LNRAQLEKRLAVLESQLVVPPVRASRVLERLSDEELAEVERLVVEQSPELEQVWATHVKAHMGRSLS
jgi:hypothetical protein